MKIVALAAGGGVAIIAILLALHVLVNGRVFVPGTLWVRGYVGGVGAYSMAISWLCLGAASLFAAFMFVDRKRYFEHRFRRNASLLGFGAFFLVAVLGVIVERANPGAF